MASTDEGGWPPVDGAGAGRPPLPVPGVAVPAGGDDPLGVDGLLAVSDTLLDAGLAIGWGVRGLALATLAARDLDDGGGGDAEPRHGDPGTDVDADGGALPLGDDGVQAGAGGGDGVPLAGPDGDGGAADADLFHAGARRIVRVVRVEKRGGVTVARPVDDAEPAELVPWFRDADDPGDPDDEFGVWDDGNGREG